MRSISDNRKKRGRGRPPTGIGKPVGLRLYADLERRIDAWASKQSDKPGRPEAIRRLVEQALAVTSSTESIKPGSRRTAAEMAGQTIDQLGDRTATDEQRAHRKRRLIKGPREFREVRGDLPKKKG
jgi:hypothetical protein